MKRPPMPTSVLMLAVLMSAAAWAEEPPVLPRGGRTPTPLQVQVVIARKQSGREVARLPYSLACNADDDRRSSLRMGIEVPVAVGGGKGMQYRNVGMNIDCQASSMADGRFRLVLGIEQSSIQELDPQALSRKRLADAAAADGDGGAPLFRTFNSMFATLLRDGQGATHTAATDAVTGEEVTVEVSLKAMR